MSNALKFKHSALCRLSTIWVKLTLLVLCLAPSAAAALAAPTWPCFANVPQMNAVIPNDTVISDQPTMNCFAWQEFIALNWAAASGQRGVADPNVTAQQFGTPNASAPTVWETYKSNTEVFLPGGAKPKSWNVPAPTSSCTTSNKAVKALLRKPGARVLSMASAFGDFNLDESNQASGQWLADQNGNLIYYEIKLNQDEFNAIVNNGFYNANVQTQTASTGVNPTPGGAYQVKLPAGCNAGSCPNNGQAIVGAIELKAAWRILTDPSQNARYLTSQAVLMQPTGACSVATVGLVGLHIVHKTVTQPQFIWATFEHIDNVPPAAPATFNNPACQCQTAIPNTCTSGTAQQYQNCTSTQTTGQACTPNTPPPYNNPSANCKSYPIQVTRSRPLSNNSSDPVVATNTAAQQLIISANSQSVFQYYQLVDVLWSGSTQDSYNNLPKQPGPQVPLSMSGATPDPSALPVANTTMETYVQSQTCLSCHIYASVPGSNYASDFSFIMGEAQAPKTSNFAATAKPRRSLPKEVLKLMH